MFAFLFDGVEKALRELLQELHRQQIQGAYVRGWQDGALIVGVFVVIGLLLFLGMDRSAGAWRYVGLLAMALIGVGLVEMTLARQAPPCPAPVLKPAPEPPRRRPRREDPDDRVRHGCAPGEAPVRLPGADQAPGGADPRTGGT